MKIEAIQCFPCYVKVTLLRTDANPLIVRITIPGLHVQLAASRTKQHCYGLFWKSNRKRCSIFLGFPSEQDRCLHMGWLKEAVKDLERYRQGEDGRGLLAGNFLGDFTGPHLQSRYFTHAQQGLLAG